VLLMASLYYCRDQHEEHGSALVRSLVTILRVMSPTTHSKCDFAFHQDPGGSVSEERKTMTIILNRHHTTTANTDQHDVNKRS